MTDQKEVTYETYLQLALSLAKEAGEVIRASWNRPKKIDTKSSIIDCVTQTDRDCEKIIIDGIKKHFPDHRFIAEESHKESGVYDVTDEPTWLVDPVDGTNNFVHSLPFVCVCIGLMIKKEVCVAVVYNPIINETFHAIRGQGAFLNGTERIKTSPVEQLERSVIATEFGYDRSPEGIDAMLGRLHNLLTARTQSVRMFGSCAINMCYVACGRLEAYYEGRDEHQGPKPWDYGAASLIVTEAGGVVADPTGKPLNLYCGRVLAAANDAVAQQLLKTIQLANGPKL